MDCEFCKYNMTIEPSRIVYEDEEYIAFMSKEPLINGHCVLVTKNHHEFIDEVKDLPRLFRFIGCLCQAIKDAVNANHIRLEMRYGNDNQKINHLHIHLIPAFMKDEDARFAEKISDADVKILENLRKGKWYSTLNL